MTLPSWVPGLITSIVFGAASTTVGVAAYYLQRVAYKDKSALVELLQKVAAGKISRPNAPQWEEAKAVIRQAGYAGRPAIEELRTKIRVQTGGTNSSAYVNIDNFYNDLVEEGALPADPRLYGNSRPASQARNSSTPSVHSTNRYPPTQGAPQRQQQQPPQPSLSSLHLATSSQVVTRPAAVIPRDSIRNSVRRVNGGGDESTIPFPRLSIPNRGRVTSGKSATPTSPQRVTPNTPRTKPASDGKKKTFLSLP